MNAIALIPVYVLPVLFAFAIHEYGRPRKVRAPVTHPADPVDHNFDSMWEAARHR